MKELFDFQTWLDAPETQERFAREAEEQSRRDAARMEEFAQAKQGKWVNAVKSIAGVQEAEEVFGENQDTEAVRAVRRWLVSKSPRGLCIRGPIGCGKTHAALCAVKAWAEPRIVDRQVDADGPRMLPGRRVSWLSPDKLISAVLHAYDKDSPALHPYVVLDDMGRETKPDFQEALCRVLESAEDGVGRTLLITSNLTKEQMRHRYEPRLLDRLGHFCVAVDVRGPSLRRSGGF